MVAVANAQRVSEAPSLLKTSTVATPIDPVIFRVLARATKELHQVFPARQGDFGASRLGGDDAETGGVAKAPCGLGEARRVQGGAQGAGPFMAVNPTDLSMVGQAARKHARPYAGMRTGRDSMPRTKLEYTRFGSPTTSILSKRLSISCHTIFSCSSASRMPTQR